MNVLKTFSEPNFERSKNVFGTKRNVFRTFSERVLVCRCGMLNDSLCWKVPVNETSYIFNASGMICLCLYARRFQSTKPRIYLMQKAFRGNYLSLFVYVWNQTKSELNYHAHSFWILTQVTRVPVNYFGLVINFVLLLIWNSVLYTALLFYLCLNWVLQLNYDKCH